MKRYLVFTGTGPDCTYGWHNFLGDFSTLFEATEAISADDCWDYAHIVDTKTKKIVNEYRKPS